MSQPHEIQIVVEVPAGRAERTREKPGEVAETARAATYDRLAGDLLLRALAQRLVAVEEWCGNHSEYFLG